MTAHFIPPVRVLIGSEERRAVDRVLRSGVVVQGQEVAHFEAEFSAIVGDRPCVAVNSGTSALHLGLLAAGIGPGDEVIVPSFTFAATANAVAVTGAEPVFADIDPVNFCLNPEAVRAAITPRTAAILPVHLYGHPADIQALREIASRHGLALFEDACQAHAAKIDGEPVGTLGQFAAFSFYATKNMTTGEGGMVVCEDEEVARTVRLLRNQGMERRYANEVIGFNFRMTDIAAAIGRVQLQQLAGWTEVRRRNAQYFDAHIAGVVTPKVATGIDHVYHQYTVRHPQRDRLHEALTAEGIGAMIYYPTPVHRLAPYNQSLDLPETHLACSEVLSIPVHPGVSIDGLERVVRAVNRHSQDA